MSDAGCPLNDAAEQLAPSAGQPGGGVASLQYRRWRQELGAGLTAVAVLLAAAACTSPAATGSASIPSAGPVRTAPAGTVVGPWKLVTPARADGLPLDHAAAASGAFDLEKPALSKMNPQLKSAGKASSTAFGTYDLRPASGPGQAPPVVVFEGYDGKFSPSDVLRKVEARSIVYSPVPAGPHGGMAVCGSSGTGTSAADVCIWVTSTTLARLILGASTINVGSLAAFMVRMRADLEVPR